MYFNHNLSTSKFQPLSLDQIQRMAPSVFALEPWQRMSDKYQFVPTVNIVRGMQAEGFEVVKAIQSRSRIEGKSNFTKHMLRFRRSDAPLVVGDTFPEVVLVNSHDGTSSYSLYAGMFRLTCLNGMVCSMGNFGEYKTRHSGDIQREVIDAAYRIVEDFPQVTERAQEWRGVHVSGPQQIAYAESAALLRWDEGQDKPSDEQLLKVRRSADMAERDTMWGTYQRVQEAMLKGGNSYRRTNEQGRWVGNAHVRAVKGIDQDVKLNKALWALTEKMSALVSA